MTRTQKLCLASLALWAVLLCLGGCDTRAGPTANPTPMTTPSPSATPRAVADLEHDDKTDTDEIADDEESEDNAEEFHGYRCRVDCSGHQAGYRWAEEHDIRDPDDCGGKSQSFIEGCRAWAEENP